MVSDQIKDGVKKYLLEIISNKIEDNCTLLRPFIKRLISSEFLEEYRTIFNPEDGRRRFTISRTWFWIIMKGANLSYRKVTNDAGKLPTTWEEDKDTFFVHAAYLVCKYNVPGLLFINIDKTSLNHIASTGRT